MRLIDSSGAPSNAGLLQVRTGNPDSLEFGSVCGMDLVCVFYIFRRVAFGFGFGKCTFRQAAADVVCAQLGYDFGIVSTSACTMYGGSNVCGALGSPVAMASLSCSGSELDIKDCSFTMPDTECATHSSDSVVFCGNNAGIGLIDSGALRLLDVDGAPSVDGVGRLEVFRGNAWGPICYSGFNAGAASVACKAMGFEGAAADGFARCRRGDGGNWCGQVAPTISEVACAGQETNLLLCPHVDADDVFCAPEESVVLHCSGVGDAQGRPRKVLPPAVEVSE